MRRAVIFALASFALVACSGGPTYDYETVVKSQLRDPESAQFSDVTVNVESACGFVNSKNAFGGYSGRQPFVAVGPNVTFLQGAGKSDSDLVAARCIDPAQRKIIQWMVNVAIEQLK